MRRSLGDLELMNRSCSVFISVARVRFVFAFILWVFFGVLTIDVPEVLGKFSSDIVVEGSSSSVFTVALFAEWFSGEHSESFPSESIWDCALKTSGFKIFLIISSWSHHGTIVGYVIPDTFSRWNGRWIEITWKPGITPRFGYFWWYSMTMLTVPN